MATKCKCPARLEKWLADGRPDPALAFTAGPERRLADLINVAVGSEVARLREALQAELDHLRPYIYHTHIPGEKCSRPACVAYARIEAALATKGSEHA